MEYTVEEVLQFVEENDVKFIRLAFCDVFGVQKNVSIMPRELPRAFSDGISFDASSIKGFLNVEDSDLFLQPDPSTLSVLPWRPSHGRVVRFFCDIFRPNGAPFEGNGRHLLRRAADAAKAAGYSIQIGTECEFYLFRTDENGDPTLWPDDRAGYFDLAPNDRGENIRREICLTLEQMDIQPESSHHESGPGQNEIDFKYDDPVRAADNLVTFKSVVKAIASQNGLYASFMPKPLASESGNGLHINLSLLQNGINIFKSGQQEHSQAAESFIAGILEKTREMTAFLNPLTNSYHRFGSFEAPRYVTWSHQNRSQLVRIPASKNAKYNRMELRSPDPACNPYVSFALLIFAGLDGIERKLRLPEPTNCNLYEADPETLASVPSLPANLGEAVAVAESGDFVADSIDAAMLRRYLAEKKEEWKAYQAADDKAQFEVERYFTVQ